MNIKKISSKALMTTIVAIGVLFALLAIGMYFQAEKAYGNASLVSRVYMTKLGGSSTNVPTATTTEGVSYLAANASTTFPAYIEKADILSLDIRMTASTSLGRLVYTYDVSNDNKPCDTDPNQCDWSIPAIASTTAPVTGVNTITYASTTPTWTWQPDGQLNATSSLNVLIPTLGSRFIRIKANCTASACALWMSGARKIQVPN